MNENFVNKRAFPNNDNDYSESGQGGVETSGGGGKHTAKPLSKNVFGPPPPTIHPPPFWRLSAISLKGQRHRPDQLQFLRPPKVVLEGTLRSTFPLSHSRDTFCSEKLEKAGTVDFKKHPARKVGTRSRQCGPKVSGRFAFPGARNPRICSISRSGKIFPAIFPEFSRNFPAEILHRPQKQPQPSRVF